MLLRADNIQKQYNDFKLNCSIQVEEGCVTGLIGANGAGKSTLFKAILGLIQTDGGSIELLGKNQKTLTISDKEDIGVVLAENTFSCMLTIKDIIAIMKAMYHRFDKEQFVQKCEKYQLPFDKQLKEFSTGMKAKLKLLTAMSYDAKLLLLDEPTVGLDSVIRSELLDEMREFMNQEGRAILISSHISSDLEGLCDDFYFIQNGSILLHEDTDVLLSDYATLKVSKEQYEKMDKRYILYCKPESFGYQVLTREKQFYLDNYQDIVAEKGSIDDLMLLLTKGEAV
ncbi:MAG: ABC transporter ATP-binding protein [Lachnospiraceae bacterium]|nr:ABC transporter ATP-binding protein [Lachnospiraceae bacterium]